MNPTTKQQIISAISEQKNVSFTYDGHFRECSPHAIGFKAGRINVLVYQFGGHTSKGPVLADSRSNWRCLDGSKIIDLEIINGEWHSFENHSRPSTCIDTLIAEVTY